MCQLSPVPGKISTESFPNAAPASSMKTEEESVLLPLAEEEGEGVCAAYLWTTQAVPNMAITLAAYAVRQMAVICKNIEFKCHAILNNSHHVIHKIKILSDDLHFSISSVSWNTCVTIT